MVANTYPLSPADRFEVFRFFNGLAGDSSDQLAKQGQLRTPVVKTFLLEHVSRHSGVPKSPFAIFDALKVTVTQIDESFFRVKETLADGSVDIGYVEQFSERFFAYYTCDHSVDAKARVNRWITRSPELDSTWFSPPLLQLFWEHDVSKRGDNRFGRLVFRHESIYEMPEDAAEEEQETADDPDSSISSAENEDAEVPERRAAKFVMGDRVGRIKDSLHNLQEIYEPLNALSALRFPSFEGRGGHDLYQNGQVTNRADSFEDHRNHVRYFYRTYNKLLDETEAVAWRNLKTSQDSIRAMDGRKGVPLVIRFDEEITQASFERWVQMAFRKNNRFRLWGEPLWMGPKKVHVYGADRHLWQPLNLELTSKGLVAILPMGTCGNTFHRLVTNIQAYISPKIEAWIGEQSFSQIVGACLSSEKLNEG